jgi:hypothetical protein
MKLVVTPMNNNMQTHLQRVLALAHGLDEPRFDADMRIDNWPENFTSEVRQLIKAFYSSGNSVELRACADLLDATTPPDVPEGLLVMLARALSDNPNTPLREK